MHHVFILSDNILWLSTEEGECPVGCWHPRRFRVLLWAYLTLSASKMIDVCTFYTSYATAMVHTVWCCYTGKTAKALLLLYMGALGFHWRPIVRKILKSLISS